MAEVPVYSEEGVQPVGVHLSGERIFGSSRGSMPRQLPARAGSLQQWVGAWEGKNQLAHRSWRSRQWGRREPWHGVHRQGSRLLGNV